MAVFLRVLAAFFCVMGLAAIPGAAQAQPAFSKQFAPSSIGSGTVTQLSYTIDNTGSGIPATDLKFTHTLPGGVTLANPANPSTTCTGGTLSAPDSGTTISYTSGAVAGTQSCRISVNVTALGTGSFSSTTDDLTSSAGNSGPASATLEVLSTRPGFSKSFSPALIPLFGTSTLTYTIDNSLSGSNVFNLSFTETLPAGVTIASPSNATADCIGSLTAANGTSNVSFFSGFLGPGGICTISLDVRADQAGSFVAQSSELTSSSSGFGSSGFSVATLQVAGPPPDSLQITKQFIDDPVAPGGTATLEFRLNNTLRDGTATNVSFSDNLDAMLSGASFAGMATLNECGGSGSGTGTFSYSGGSIVSGGSCIIRIPVSIPAGAADGNYVNTTSTVTATVAGNPVSGSAATDTLRVEGATPALTKTFLSSSVAAGSTVTLEFTITNPSGTTAMSDLNFTDNLSAFLSGARLTTGASGFCGAGSQLFPSGGGGFANDVLNVTGASLAPGASCTFTGDILIPASAPGGTYFNTTSQITGTAGGASVVGAAAGDSLLVNAGQTLDFTKSFTDDPVVAGGSATLEFTLSAPAENTADVTALAFSDDLDAMLSGAVATGTPISNVCGDGTLSGTSLLSLSGATLSPGETCTVSVTVDVPAGAAAATYTNTTSSLSGTVGGNTATAGPAVDQLIVQAPASQPLTWSKDFVGGPFLPGESLSLRYTLNNPNTGNDATGVFFTDNLGGALAGLAVTGPATVNTCGGTPSGTTFLIYTGATVPADDSCVIELPVVVPVSAGTGDYASPTSSLSATIDGAARITAPASDVLQVIADPVALSHSVLNNPVAPGGVAQVQIELVNSNPGTVSSGAFSVDYSAIFPGAATSSGTSSGCSGGVTSTGSSGVFSGSGLSFGASCTLTVNVTIPGGTATGGYAVPSGSFTGQIGSSPVTAASDTANFTISDVPAPDFSKAFSAASVEVGGTVNLTFSLQNNDPGGALTGLQFSDDLEAFLTGAVATNTPVSGCGGTLSGSSLLSFTGGSLAPSASCDITVQVQVPASATGGSYTNTSSELFQSGLSVASPASAAVTVTEQADLSVTISDAPDPIFPTQTLVYTIEVSNAGPSAAQGAQGSLTLPAGVTLVSTSGCAEDPNGAPTCTLGTIAAGDSASYTVSATVDAATTGGLNASVTASSSTADPVPGNNSAATSTTVNPQADISITKDDGVSSVRAGGTVTYIIDVANAGPSTDPSVSVADTFPANLSCSYTSTASGGATGNTASGSGNLADTLAMPSGASVRYTALCTVADTATGTLSNTATASGSVDDPVPGNNSATDSNTAVIPPALGFAKAFGPAAVNQGQISTLTFTIDNSANLVQADALAFTDPLPAQLEVASPANVTNSCSGGTVTASPGTGTISYSGGSLAFGASCTISVDVRAIGDSNAANTTSSLTSTLPTAAPATATLTINPAGAPNFTKAFAPNTVAQGETSVITFTIDNSANSIEADTLAFTDPFPAGLEVAASPGVTNTCGGSFTANAGDTSVALTGGAVAAATSCTIDVTVRAVGASNMVNTTSDLTSSLPTAGAATATLTVNAAGAPVFAKAFTPDTVNQGQISTLEFTIDNSANSIEVDSLAFSDPFPAGLEVAATPNLGGTCNGTFTASAGATDVSLSGASLPAGDSCTISVDVRAVGASNMVNTTSDLTSSLPTASAATATLTVNAAAAPGFAKAFTPATVDQGEISTMDITIDNSANSIEVDSLEFGDPFPAGLEVAAVPNLTSDCGGTVTAPAGGTTLSLRDGVLPAGGSCTISVDVRAVGASNMVNTTSDLVSSLPTAAAASATLTVNAAVAPGFAKSFAPAVIPQGGTSVMTLSIDNAPNSIEATSLAFSDAFPAGMIVATGGTQSNSCGGTLTANAGDSSISLAGGTVAAGATCAVEVSVQGLVTGALTNTTSTLTSSLADAAPASATLTVTELPLTVNMVFTPSAIEQRLATNLRYTLLNNSALPATAVSLSDTLPAGLVLSNPSVASTTCTGGTLSAPDGGSAVSYTGGTVPPNSICEITVRVTSNVVGSYPNTTEAVSSSLGASAPASATLRVDPAVTGLLTIVQNTDTDGDYVFSSSDAGVRFTITTSGGTGSFGPLRLNQGEYVFTQTTPDGVGNTRISCTDDNSVGDAPARTLTVSIEPLESVICTFTSISSRQKTVDTINSFLTKRADLILSTEPGSGRRLDRLKRGAGNATPLSFAQGDLQSFLPFSAQLSAASENYSLSTSLLQMRQAAASLALAHGDLDGVRHVSNYRWDAWMEAHYKTFDSGADTGHFAIVYLGADYLVSPDLLVGAMLQVDDMEDKNATNSTSVEGTGWMVGPYMTARLGPNLYFDGRIAAGTSRNDISPFNTYVDEFTTQRWLATAELSGDFQRGNWTIQPSASLSYFEESQNAYVDSIGVFIPRQTVSLGQVKLGPTFTGQFQTQDGTGYAPFFSIDAIYNFGDTSGVTVTNADTASTDGWRGRIQTGVDFSLRNGAQLSLGGSYDGIGRDSLDIWGLSLELNIPIHKDKVK